MSRNFQSKGSAKNEVTALGPGVKDTKLVWRQCSKLKNS